MEGHLTGQLIDITETPAGVTLHLAGHTDNGQRGVTWIHAVEFTGSRRPRIPLQAGQQVAVDCVAVHHVFTVGDQRAARVRLLGKGVQVIQGPTEQRGKVTFLRPAINQFTFTGHLVDAPVIKATHPVTEARVGVRDRQQQVHYFKCEAWRGLGAQLGQARRGGELTFTCILRRDKAGERAFDVMEVQALQSVQPQPLANAAD